jgi:hypothetical protein
MTLSATPALRGKHGRLAEESQADADSLMHRPLALGAVEREGRPFGILDAQFTTVVVAEGEPIRVALEMLLIALLVYAAPPRRMRQYSPSG